MTQISKQESPFRIGGVYRNRKGTLLRIARIDEDGFIKLEFADGHRDRNELASRWHLSTGQYEHYSHRTADLVPGELELVDGRWIARGAQNEGWDGITPEDKPAEPSPLNAAMIARDGKEAEYEGRAFRDGTWFPWHPITRQVFDNRQRWPRAGYEVRHAGCEVTEILASAAKPNPFPAFRSPDLANGPADHLNASRHLLAGLK